MNRTSKRKTLGSCWCLLHYSARYNVDGMPFFLCFFVCAMEWRPQSRFIETHIVSTWHFVVLLTSLTLAKLTLKVTCRCTRAGQFAVMQHQICLGRNQNGLCFICPHANIPAPGRYILRSTDAWNTNTLALASERIKHALNPQILPVPDICL